MPRKREGKPANFYAVFPERLREIMQVHGTTQQELAEYIGKSRQAIGYYADGSSSPDWETLASIAQYFRVSTDWLLGLTDTQSSDFAIQQICKYTGLSECAVDTLAKMSVDYANTINRMITAEPFKTLIYYMDAIFMKSDSQMTREPEKHELDTIEKMLAGTKYSIISKWDLYLVYTKAATDALKQILNKTVSLDDI